MLSFKTINSMKITDLLKTLSLALIMCATTQMQAADVNLATAQNAAKAFMNRQVATGRLKAAAATNLQLVKAEASVARPTAVDYYIFNSDRSYVVIAGDDLAPQVLMYGEEGKLDMNNIPPAMQWLLNKYKYQIDGIKAGTLAPVKAPKYATTPVAPLVTANWDQTAPYYNQCPTSGSRRTLTGCPATSMSMNYYKWKWPETYPACVAIASSNYGVAAAALPERAADWANIIDEYTGPTNTSYTTAQANAVAWLMRYAGQSMVNYMYGTSASGANDPDILVGAHNMGYTDAQLLTLTELVQSGWSYSNGSQNYTDTQWNEWMMNELQNGRPIEYLAYDSKNSDHGGHAFNVFGCNASGQYYVNWGWSGSSNGYCTLHNFTTANGSTSGSSGSYIFNWGEAMIIGIEPPAGALTNPRITVNPSTITMNATVGTPATTTFTVTGANLTDNVSLSVSGDNAFSLSTSSISASQAESGATVTVTYNPSKVGTHEATVTLSSTDADNVTVKLNGTAEAAPLETYAPVMLDATNITSTAFTATWTDQTPAENVSSYTLYVSNKPAVALLDSTDWTSSNTVPTGWTAQGLNYYSTNNACYLSAQANGYVQTKTYDLTGYDKMTVMVYAQGYSSGGTNSITVATSKSSKSVSSLNNDSFNWYTLVVDCANSDYVKLTTSGMPDLRYMKVYAGDISSSTQLKAAETGDATYRVITGITGKTYTVSGLTEGGTFNYYVVANYVNGAIDNSNTKQVTLLENTNPAIIVNPTTLDMTANTGESETATFNVSGSYLTGNVTLTMTDENGVYTITPTTISAADAKSGKDITVTYAPTTSGSHNATITLSSAGAESVTVTLNGTATLRKEVPVMQPVDTNYVHLTSFRADWTDETPEANVESYTLWVNTKSTAVEPTLLEEANFTSLDAVTNSSNQLTNVVNSASSYLPTGWTAQNGLWINQGFICSGYLSSTTCGITSATYDFTGYDKATIVMSAYSYYSSNYGTATIRVKTSAGSKELQLATDDFTTYTVVLDVAESDQVVFEGVANLFAIEDIKIYAGDISQTTQLRVAVEEGDSTTRTITGITDKFYTVKDLTAGGTFDYCVKAIYTDGTESGWSNVQQVTLIDRPYGLLGDVNNDGVVDVTDINILVNIVLGKEQASNYDGRAYINDDDVVDVTDINMVVNIVLGKGNTTQALRKNAYRQLMIEGFNK